MSPTRESWLSRECMLERMAANICRCLCSRSAKEYWRLVSTHRAPPPGSGQPMKALMPASSPSA
ncbi:MAG: hypothetical protein Q4F72_12910 [Desulfovibrionaceae bacterium]|nr:hypothetical protein [Desulfovibrionaceae bacterium]